MPGALVLSGAIALGHTMPERSFRALLDELEQGNAGSCGARAADICVGALAILDAGTGLYPGHAPPRWEPAYRGALARIGLDIAVGCHEEARP